MGQIIVPNDEELCDTKGEKPINNKDSNTRTIMLVQRGTCKFTKKVINAQELGADLIIIYNNEEGDKPTIIMKNDGHGHLAEIPSLFISKTDGLSLKKKTTECAKLPVVRVQFEMDQSQVSEVTFWLDAGNRETYILAREFHKNDYYDVLSDKMNMKIGFKLEEKCETWICSKDDCVGPRKELYCRNVKKPDNSQQPYTKGVDLIHEQIREYFLW